MTKKYLNLAKIVVITALLTISASYIYADWSGPPGVPTACPDSTPGCNVPINEGVVAQVKRAGLGLWGRFYTKDKASIGLDDPTTMTSSLKLQVNGKVGADAYCDQAGNNCIIPPGGADGGLWRAVPNTQMIENANNGKVRINGKIIITGGKPFKDKILVAQDETGVARWRSLAELGVGNLAVTCGAGKAIQDIKPDGSPVCVSLSSGNTSSGISFIFDLLPSSLISNLTQPDPQEPQSSPNCFSQTSSHPTIPSLPQCLGTAICTSYNTNGCVTRLCCR